MVRIKKELLLYPQSLREHGFLAQLVQSIWFTPRGSGVRIPQDPQNQEEKQTKLLKTKTFRSFSFSRLTENTAKRSSKNKGYTHFLEHYPVFVEESTFSGNYSFFLTQSPVPCINQTVSGKYLLFLPLWQINDSWS